MVKKTEKKEKAEGDPAKKIGVAKLDQSNIVTGTRKRKQVDYSDSKATRTGHPVAREAPVESANILEKRSSMKIEKPKRTKKAGTTTKKTTEKKTTTKASTVAKK